ncbi:MAG: hypothetical protein RLZZ401_127, partial [Pseudomonadota bacterium]
MSLPALAYSWPVESLRALGAEHFPGLGVEVVAELDSTNSELMRRAHAGQATPTLLVAERQTAGRGRLGRVWAAAASSHGVLPSLTFSLGLPLACADWSGLSLVVGLSVVQGVVQCAAGPVPGLGLKWPNDLWWHGSKLSGILIETAAVGGTGSRYAVIGIGINLLAPSQAELPQALPGGVEPVPAVGLRALVPGLDAAKVLHSVLPRLIGQVRRFEQQGFAPFRDLFVACDLLHNQAVRLSDGRNGI